MRGAAFLGLSDIAVVVRQENTAALECALDPNKRGKSVPEHPRLILRAATHLEAIAADCAAEQQKTPRERGESIPDDCLFPPSLGTSDGGGIAIGERGIEALRELAALIHAEFPNILQTADRDVVYKELGKGVGDVLFAMERGDADVSNWNDAARKVVDVFLRACDDLKATITWLIPCHVFDTDQGVPAFDIGPVRFWPREGWLSATKQNIRQDTVTDLWSGTITEQEARNRAFSSEGLKDGSYAANELAELSRDYAWLATITIEAHEPTRSRQKANIVAELALNALTLLMEQKTGADVFVAGTERRARFEHHLGFSDEGRLLSGWHSNRPGISRGKGEAPKFIEECESARRDAGVVLQRYLDDSAKGAVPFLIDRWVNALYWFGQATREPVDFMALVKHGCAVDILTGASGKIAAMVNYCEAALGLPRGSRIGTGPMTLKQAIERVYSKGRSELAHGSTNGLLLELGADRGLGHKLARMLLQSALRSLSSAISRNDPILDDSRVKPRHALRGLKNQMERQRKARTSS